MATKRHASDSEKLVENLEETLEPSILYERKRPRRLVDNWGISGRKMGTGMEDSRDPLYFHRPIFNQLWENSYLGVGDDGAKTINIYQIPRQHLFYLSLLLHKAFLNGHYIQAAYLLVAISQNPRYLPEQIWRCGMEVLKKCNMAMIGTLRKFQKLISNLCPQYSNQIVLDMAFEILRKGNDVKEAYQFLLNNVNNRRVKYDPLFGAYIGMFEYVLWRADIERQSCKNDFSEEISRGKTVNEITHFNAKRALESMESVLAESGIWDVFVLKVLEIYDYYNQREKAVLLLQNYREKNCDNPNTHRYLYWYLKRIGRSKEERFPVLKDLVEHDATDELAIEFIEIIREKDQNLQILDLLFKRLDHPGCKNSLFDWTTLYKIFKTYKRNQATKEWKKIQTCLTVREEWWPKYHFGTSKKKCESETEEMLERYKRKIGRFYKAHSHSVRLV